MVYHIVVQIGLEFNLRQLWAHLLYKCKKYITVIFLKRAKSFLSFLNNNE